MSEEHEKLRRIDGDLELIAARTAGLTDNLVVLGGYVAELTRQVGKIAEAVVEMRTKAAEDRTAAPTAASSTLDERKVWVVEVPEGDAHGVGPVHVMIEQFGRGTPTVAFRRQRHQVWGRPYSGEERP